MAAYPTVEAAEEVSEDVESEETADAADSDEPSDEEIATEEESNSEDIDEAGEEEDLSSFDVEEEDEEEVEETEEEEVVEETEEADAEDPSFSDSEDTSDTTETDAVEEEAEEEEEVVEEEVEEEEEATDSEEQVVEAEAEAEGLNASTNNETITLALDGVESGTPMHVGETIPITVTANVSPIESSMTEIKNISISDVTYEIYSNAEGSSEDNSGEYLEITENENKNLKTASANVKILKPLTSHTIKATAKVTYWYKDGEGNDKKDGEKTNVTSGLLSFVTTDPLSALAETETSKAVSVSDNVAGTGTSADPYEVLQGAEDAGITAKVKGPSTEENDGISFVEYAWTYGSTTTYTYGTREEGSDVYESTFPIDSSAIVNDKELSVKATAYYKKDGGEVTIPTEQPVEANNQLSYDTTNYVAMGAGVDIIASSSKKHIKVSNGIKSVTFDSAPSIVYIGDEPTEANLTATITMKDETVKDTLDGTTPFKFALDTDNSAGGELDTTHVTITEVSTNSAGWQDDDKTYKVNAVLKVADGFTWANLTSTPYYLQVIPVDKTTATKFDSAPTYSTEAASGDGKDKKSIIISKNALIAGNSSIVVSSEMGDTVPVGGVAKITATIKSNKISNTPETVGPSSANSADKVKFTFKLGDNLKDLSSSGVVLRSEKSGGETATNNQLTVVSDSKTAEDDVDTWEAVAYLDLTNYSGGDITSGVIDCTAQAYQTVGSGESAQEKAFGYPVDLETNDSVSTNSNSKLREMKLSFENNKTTIYAPPAAANLADSTQEDTTTIKATITAKKDAAITDGTVWFGLKWDEDTYGVKVRQTGTTGAYTVIKSGDANPTWIAATKGSKDSSGRQTYTASFDVKAVGDTAIVTDKFLGYAKIASASDDAGSDTLSGIESDNLSVKANPITSMTLTVPAMAVGMSAQSATLNIVVDSDHQKADGEDAISGLVLTNKNTALKDDTAADPDVTNDCTLGDLTWDWDSAGTGIVAKIPITPGSNTSDTFEANFFIQPQIGTTPTNAGYAVKADPDGTYKVSESNVLRSVTQTSDAVSVYTHTGANRRPITVRVGVDESQIGSMTTTDVRLTWAWNGTTATTPKLYTTENAGSEITSGTGNADGYVFKNAKSKTGVSGTGTSAYLETTLYVDASTLSETQITETLAKNITFKAEAGASGASESGPGSSSWSADSSVAPVSGNSKDITILLNPILDVTVTNTLNDITGTNMSNTLSIGGKDGYVDVQVKVDPTRVQGTTGNYSLKNNESISITPNVGTAAALTAVVDGTPEITLSGSDYIYTQRLKLTAGTTAGTSTLSATATYTGANSGHPITSLNKSTDITINKNFLTKVSSVSVDKSQIYVGGANAIATAKIAGAAPADATDKYLEVTWALNKNSSGSAATDSSSAKLYSIGRTDGEITGFTDISSTNKKAVALSDLPYSNGEYTVEVAVSGEQLSDGVYLSISKAEIVDAETGSSQSTISGYTNGDVKSLKVLDDSTSASTNGCAKLTVGNPIAGNIEFNDTDKELEKGLVTGESKTLKTTVTLNNIIKETVENKWDYVHIKYTWTNNPTGTGTVKIQSANAANADGGFRALNMGSSDVVSSGQAAEIWVPASEFSATDLSYEDVVTITGGTADDTNAGYLSVDARVVKGTISATPSTGAGTLVGVAATQKKIGYNTTSGVGTLFVHSPIVKVLVNPASGSTNAVVGDTYNLYAEVRSYSSSITDVKAIWGYQGTTGKPFGEVTTWKNEGVVALAPDASDNGTVYRGSLNVKIKAVATGDMALTISYKVNGVENTMSLNSDAGSIVGVPALGTSFTIARDGTDTLRVGDTIKLKATATAATDNIDKVEITWPTNGDYFEWVSGGTATKNADGDTVYVQGMTGAEKVWTATAEFKILKNNSSYTGTLSANATAYQKDSSEASGFAALATKDISGTFSGVACSDNAFSAITVKDKHTGTRVLAASTGSMASTPYYLWYNGSGYTDIDVLLTPSTGDSSDIKSARIIPTWNKTSGEGTVKFYDITATGTTGSEAAYFDTTTKDGGDFKRTIRMIGSGGSAQGTISFAYAAYSTETISGTTISDTGKVGNTGNIKTINISVRQNPIIASTNSDGSDRIPVMSATNIKKGSSEQLSWRIKTPYGPDAAETPSSIKIVLTDPKDGQGSYTTQMTFPKGTGAGRNEFTLGSKDIVYDSTEKAYFYELKTEVAVASGATSFSGAQIKAVASPVSSGNWIGTQSLTKSTAANIESNAAASGITKVELAYDETNDRTLTLGGDDASAFTKTTLTAKISATQAMDDASATFTWNGQAGAVSVKKSDGSPITQSGQSWTISGIALTDADGNGVFTGEAAIEITALKKDVATFTVNVSDTKTLDSEVLTILDWLKEAKVEYTREGLSATEYTLSGDVVRSVNVYSGKTIHVKATITPNSNVQTGRILALQTKWTWNGEAGAVIVDPKDETKTAKTVTITTKNPQLTSGKYVVDAQFETNAGYDGTNGTFSVEVAAYQNATDYSESTAAGGKVSATTVGKLAIGINPIMIESFVNNAPEEKIYTNSSSTDWNLKATIKKASSISDITKVVLTWQCEDGGTTTATLKSEDSDTAGASATTEITWSGDSKDAYALLWANNAYAKKNITLTAQAYHKNESNVEVAYGDAVEKNLIVSVLNARTLALRNGADTENVENDTIDVVAGTNVTIGTSGTTYVIKGGASNGAIGDGELSGALDSELAGLTVTNSNKASGDAKITLAAGTGLTEYATRKLTVTAAENDTDHKATKDITLRVWPYVVKDDLVVSPSSLTVNSKATTEFTLDVKDGSKKALYNGNAGYITWKVYRGEDTTTEDTGNDIATIRQNASDPRKATLTIQPGNTYTGPIVVGATVSDPIASGTSSFVVASTGISVETVLNSISVNADYRDDNSNKIYVNRTQAWGTTDNTKDNSRSGSVFTLTPALDVDEYIISYSEGDTPKYARLNPYLNKNNKPTGAFWVEGLAAGSTSIIVKAKLNNIETQAVEIPITVEQDKINLTLSRRSLNTYSGGIINLDDEAVLPRSVELASGEDLSQAQKSAVDYVYTTEDEWVSISGNTLTGGTTGGKQATVKVTPVLEGYEGVPATFTVNVYDALSSVEISPNEYYLGRATTTEDTGNKVKLYPSTNMTSTSGYSLAYKWTTENTNITFSASDTDQNPEVQVNTAFTEDADIDVNVRVTQTFTGVVDAAASKYNAATSIVKNGTMKLHIRSGKIELVPSTGVSLSKDRMVFTTATSASKSIKATIDKPGARGVKYDWYVLNNNTNEISASNNITNGHVVELNLTNNDGGVPASDKTDAVNAAVSVGTEGAKLSEAKTVYVRVVATQPAAQTTGTSNIVATKTIPVTIYPAAAEPEVYAVDRADTKREKTEYGGNTNLIVGSTYDLAYKIGSEVGAKPEGYSFNVEASYSKLTDDDGNEYTDETSYVSTTNIPNTDGTGSFTAQKATIGTAAPAWTTDRGAITVKYTLTMKDEDDKVLHEVSGSRKFNVEDSAISSLALNPAEQMKIVPGNTGSIKASTNSGASDVDWTWTLTRTSDNANITTNGDSNIRIAGSNKTATLILMGIQATTTQYKATVTATNTNTTSGTMTKDCLITVASDRVAVENVSLTADGKAVGAADNSYLNNDKNSTMAFKAVLTPDTPYNSMVNWSVNDSSIAGFKNGDATVASITKDASETVYLVPGTGTGSVTVMAVAAGGTGKFATTTVTVGAMPLMGVKIMEKNFMDQTIETDTIHASGTIDLVAQPNPSTASYEKVEWSIKPTAGTSSPEGGALIESSEGNKATIKGYTGKTNGSYSYTVTAKIFDKIDGTEVEVGDDTFVVLVTRDEIAIDKIFLNKISETIEVGSESIPLEARYLPTGASADSIGWSVLYTDETPDTSGNIATISKTSGTTTTVTASEKITGTSTALIGAYDTVNYTNYKDAKAANHAAAFSLTVKALTASRIEDISIVGKDNGAYVLNTDPDTKASFVVVKAGETLTLSGVPYSETKAATDKSMTWTATGAAGAITGDDLVANEDKTIWTLNLPKTPQTVVIKGTSGDGLASTADIQLDVAPALTASNFTAAIPDGKYTGAAYVPAVSGTYRGIEVSGSDIKVETDADPINAGDKTLKISAGANGKYTIATPIEKSYKINPITMSDASVKLSVGSYNATYDGKAKTPAVSATISGNAYTPAKVTYSNNINAGTATAKVDGDGKNVTGSKNVTFAINKAASSFTVGNITLTGAKAATISPKNGNGVKSYTYALTSGKSYVTLSGNKLTGKLVGKNKAKVRVTGVGDANHNNSVKDITITVNKPAKVTNVKPATTKKHIVQAKWKKSTSATGYVVQLSTSKKFTKKTTKTVTIKKASTVKYNFKKCTKGKRYYTRVYAYVGNNKTANRSKVSAKKYVVCK